MILTVLTFVIALLLSAVAAYYSIVGLTAIFAAATVPIIIMGSVLEVAKLVVTVWLHDNWHRCRLIMKLYLVPAVAVLMLITSMGIFGFLSKAHLDQAVPVGDVAAQVALIDEKISNERQIVENARSLLAQLDKAVVDISNGPDREFTLRNGERRVQSAAERALQVRRSQAQDRARLTDAIEASQGRIVALQQERAPFAKDLRKIEAEVGPIKYVAALLYGDNPDINMLERAVRWMIVILVLVFDPLAVMMLLAATESRTWQRQEQQSQTHKEPDHVHHISPDPTHDVVADAHSVGNPDPEPESAQPHVPAMDFSKHAYLRTPGFGFRNPQPQVASRTEPADVYSGKTFYNADYVKALEDSIANKLELDPETQKQLLPEPDNAVWDEEYEPDDDAVIKQAKHFWKQDHPGKTLKEQRRLLELGVIDREPWLDYVDDPRIRREAGFGRRFPESADKGDLFVRTDRVPTELFKYTGQEWIKVDKNQTDNYSYNDSYIEHLVDMLSSGEYDPDLLTDAERIQIEQVLASGK